MTDAIEKDVSEVKEEATDTKEVIDERMEDLERIAQQHQANVKDDMVALDDDGQPIEESEGEPEDDGEETEDSDTEEESDDEEEETEVPEEEVEIKVDGEVQKVPLSKLLDAGKRTLQKETTADKRLEEATKLKRELEELRQSLRPSRPDVEVESPDKKLEEAEKKLANATLYGKEEEIIQAQREYREALKETIVPKTQPVDVNRVVNDAIKTNEIKRTMNLPPEDGGFSDLMSVPELASAVSREVDKILQGASSQEEAVRLNDDINTYRKAGEAVRTRMQKLFGSRKTEADVEAERQEKIKRKQKLDTVKPMSKKTAKPPEEKTPSNQETIQDMAKRRNQEIF